MEALNEYILGAARKAGICQEWAERIAVTGDAGDLLKMYRDGIDFCLANDFPSNADLIRLAGPLLADHGITVDGHAASTRDFSVLLGNSTGELSFDLYKQAEVFVKHNSTLQLAAFDNSFVVIDCFDNSNVEITASDESKVLVNIYGNATVTTTKSGNAFIKIVKKNKSTY